MRCSKCNCEVDSSWKMCPYCGVELNKVKICPGCNEEVQDGWKMCPHCGKQLEENIGVSDSSFVDFQKAYKMNKEEEDKIAKENEEKAILAKNKVEKERKEREKLEKIAREKAEEERVLLKIKQEEDLCRNNSKIVSGSLNKCNLVAPVIRIPSEVTKIYYEALWNTKAEHIIVPEGVTRISDYTFGIFSGTLKTVTLPNSLVEIGNTAFNKYTEMRINYNGTISEWKKVRIFCGFNNVGGFQGLKATIVCTDGTINLNAC